MSNVILGTYLVDANRTPFYMDLQASSGFNLAPVTSVSQRTSLSLSVFIYKMSP